MQSGSKKQYEKENGYANCKQWFHGAKVKRGLAYSFVMFRLDGNTPDDAIFLKIIDMQEIAVKGSETFAVCINDQGFLVSDHYPADLPETEFFRQAKKTSITQRVAINRHSPKAQSQCKNKQGKRKT